jgi:hypothetical protein
MPGSLSSSSNGTEKLPFKHHTINLAKHRIHCRTLTTFKTREPKIATKNKNEKIALETCVQIQFGTWLVRQE